MRKRLAFIVSGSKGDEYEVVFHRDDANLTATCSCQAGQFGQYCKHRFGLMDGVADGLLSDNAHELAALRDMMAGTDVEAAYAELLAAEAAHAETKRLLTGAKRKLARTLRD